jgi:hypothetical protein
VCVIADAIANSNGERCRAWSLDRGWDLERFDFDAELDPRDALVLLTDSLVLRRNTLVSPIDGPAAFANTLVFASDGSTARANTLVFARASTRAHVDGELRRGAPRSAPRNAK